MKTPRFTVTASGLLMEPGQLQLEPSSPRWRRVRCFWRVRLPDGRRTPWRPTARLALAAAAALFAAP